MKLNNKGFAITLVLYGTLVLFLLLIVSLLGILSTYKLRLEKIYPEEEPLNGKLTCRITNSYYDTNDGWISIELSVSDENLLYSENPYCFGTNCEATARFDKQYSNSWEEYKVKVKDKNGTEVDCGTAIFYLGTWGYYDTEFYCTNTYAVPNEDVKFGSTSSTLSGSYSTESDARSACTARCQPPQYKYKSGCKVKQRVYKSCSNVDGSNCN